MTNNCSTIESIDAQTKKLKNKLELYKELLRDLDKNSKEEDNYKLIIELLESDIKKAEAEKAEIERQVKLEGLRKSLVGATQAYASYADNPEGLVVTEEESAIWADFFLGRIRDISEEIATLTN